MKQREYIISLFEIYNELLTTKQQQYFKDYYYEDLSLSEIAENYNVSKSFVGKTIKITEDKLNNFENKLQIVTKNIELNKLSKQIKDLKLKKELNKIING